MTINKLTKTALASASSIALLFGLSACSTASEDTATPVDEATPAVAEVCTEGPALGDVQSAALASNSQGDYCSVELIADSAGVAFDPSVVSPALYEAGFTDEQLAELQNLALNRYLMLMADSPAMGLPNSEVQEWFTALPATDYLESSRVDYYKNSTPEGFFNTSSLDIAFNSYESFPPLAYSIEPEARLSSMNFEVESIGFLDRVTGVDQDAGITDPTVNVAIKFRAITDYNVDNEQIFDWTKNFYSKAAGKTDASGVPITEEALVEEYTTPFVDVDLTKPVTLVDFEQEVSMSFRTADVGQVETPLISHIDVTPTEFPKFWKYSN